MWSACLMLGALLLVVALPAQATASELPGRSGRLVVTVREAGVDEPLPCRAWVETSGGRRFEPDTSGATPYARDRSFSCDGTFGITLPAGKATVHVERGKEYFPVRREVRIPARQTAELTIELERWVDMAADGWYSADMHVHFGNDNLDTLRQLALADDVNWLPSFTYWNQFERQWPPFEPWPSVSASKRHLVTLPNIEIERIGGPPFHSVGALFLFGLREPVFVERHSHVYPCDATLARLAKEASPSCVIDTDKPLWAENVVTMAFGLFDSVQVCHNHFHRLQTIHGGGLCCGMADDSIEEHPRDWGGDELFLRTNMVYYRWLNCGFRLAVSGGSAMGVMDVPLGYSRTYARLDGPLAEESYLDAVRRGRTFATSGPMLMFTVDDHEPGDTIALQGGEHLRVTARAEVRSIERLESLELIQNGRVVHQVSLGDRIPDPVLTATFETPVSVDRSGWLAARALYRNVDGHLRQAHASPVYVSLDGRPTASRRDALYMIRWIDRLLEVADTPGRYATDADREEVKAIYRDARAVYEQIARTAEDARVGR